MYEVQQSLGTHLWHGIREQAISLASKGVVMGNGVSQRVTDRG
jgi:hypothetical protein